MATPVQATRLYLSQRPTPEINENTFKSEKVAVAATKSDEVLVRVDYLSIDPAMRGWLDDKRSYLPPVQIGATMRAIGVGTVHQLPSGYGGKLKVGDAVKGTFGWTDYAVMEESQLQLLQVSEDVSILEYLGAFGGVGMTAYFGLLDVGKLKAGETCVVSGAAGAVGSIVCQIAKIKGAKVIAIAGSPDKCDWLEKDLGVDKALNYKSPTFVEDFKKHVGYLDVYFDNVGGEILDLCLTRLNKNARIALCGAISDYNKKPNGLSGYLNLISQRATLQGFIVFDYASRYPEAIKDFSQWKKEGKLKMKYHIVEGLEKCPEYLKSLFVGANTGKLVVRISEVQSKL